MDLNQIELQGYKVKYTADRMANAATLLTDEYSYSLGRIVFTCDEGNALALEVLKGNLGYDSSYRPVSNTYFTETADIDLYYFDDSLSAKHYKNGTLVGTFRFSYGNYVTDYVPSYKEMIVITKPSVVCIFNAGRPYFTPVNSAVMAGNRVDIVKQSFYEYK